MADPIKVFLPMGGREIVLEVIEGEDIIEGLDSSTAKAVGLALRDGVRIFLKAVAAAGVSSAE